MARSNWTRARDDYIVGNESFSQIALRLGVKKKAVEAHACNRRANDGRTWGELRTEYRRQVSRELLRKEAALATENAKLRLLVTNKSLAELQRRIEGRAIKNADL